MVLFDRVGLVMSVLVVVVKRIEANYHVTKGLGGILLVGQKGIITGDYNPQLEELF